MIDPSGKIYVAGHRGLVGSAVCRRLAALGHTRVVARAELDLLDRDAVTRFLHMPQLGAVNRAQGAALAGLAPFFQQSGRWTGETHIAGGRARLRCSLYVAALPPAFRWIPALKAFYRRLIDRGRAYTVALVACARKPLVFANAVVVRGTPWSERPTAP